MKKSSKIHLRSKNQCYVASLCVIWLTAFIYCQSEIYAYQYNPRDKLDPFMMFQKEHDELRSTGVKFGNYDAAALTLGGTMIGNRSSAILLSPDAKDGIVVKVGDKIGKNGGKVVSITRNKVMIRESYKTKSGAERYQDVRLEMARAVKNPRPDQPGVVGSAPAGVLQAAQPALANGATPALQVNGTKGNSGQPAGGTSLQQPSGADPNSCLPGTSGAQCVPLSSWGAAPGYDSALPSALPHSSEPIPADPMLQGLTDPQLFGIPTQPAQSHTQGAP